MLLCKLFIQKNIFFSIPLLYIYCPYLLADITKHRKYCSNDYERMDTVFPDLDMEFEECK